MENPRLIIVEDEFAIAEDMRSVLESEGYSVVNVFTSAEAAISPIIAEAPDLLLVDIKLSGHMTGIQMVTQLRSKISIPVVYITANSDHSTFENAKNTRPSAFLIKPFTHANLLATIDLALYNFFSGIEPEKIVRVLDSPSTELVIGNFLFVKSNNRYKKIRIDDILFAEASGSYVHVQTAEQRFTLTQNLTHFQKKSPLPNLLRIHRSYIVNLTKVDSFDDSFVFIRNHKLPLSETYRTEFLSSIHLL